MLSHFMYIISDTQYSNIDNLVSLTHVYTVCLFLHLFSTFLVFDHFSVVVVCNFVLYNNILFLKKHSL